MIKFSKERMMSVVTIVASLFILILLVLLPTGYEDAVIYQGADRTIGEIISTDNSMLVSTGLIQTGEQRCRVKLLGGKFKGEIVTAVNMLNGSLEQDKIFGSGDRAQVLISYEGDAIYSISMIDHYRLDKELILAGIFVVLLVLFAGTSGIRAVLSFAITILMIWKVLVPSCLKGFNPVLLGLMICLVLTVVIAVLVYGVHEKALAASLGSLLGIGMTALLGILFTGMYNIHGAVMPYSESLLYSGFSHLNLTSIFMASIFIGSSGAVMDLAVDITSSVWEVVEHKPEITWKEAARSGINVGRAAIGTQTTTLLLAYSGGYISLLMVFMAQGTPIYNILNYKYIASEILETLIGSIGLVTVAPFTALVCGLLFTRGIKKVHSSLSL
ncbi:MAG TPA: YibE/F family protein [Clostridiales bacterium]|nr:YibE/F family protein [Clostridiales bacterium]